MKFAVFFVALVLNVAVSGQMPGPAPTPSPDTDTDTDIPWMVEGCTDPTATNFNADANTACYECCVFPPAPTPPPPPSPSPSPSESPFYAAECVAPSNNPEQTILDYVQGILGAPADGIPINQTSAATFTDINFPFLGQCILCAPSAPVDVSVFTVVRLYLDGGSFPVDPNNIPDHGTLLDLMAPFTATYPNLAGLGSYADGMGPQGTCFPLSSPSPSPSPAPTPPPSPSPAPTPTPPPPPPAILGCTDAKAINYNPDAVGACDGDDCCVLPSDYYPPVVVQWTSRSEHGIVMYNATDSTENSYQMLRPDDFMAKCGKDGKFGVVPNTGNYTSRGKIETLSDNRTVVFNKNQVGSALLEYPKGVIDAATWGCIEYHALIRNEACSPKIDFAEAAVSAAAEIVEFSGGAEELIVYVDEKMTRLDKFQDRRELASAETDFCDYFCVSSIFQKGAREHRNSQCSACNVEELDLTQTCSHSRRLFDTEYITYNKTDSHGVSQEFRAPLVYPLFKQIGVDQFGYADFQMPPGSPSGDENDMMRESQACKDSLETGLNFNVGFGEIFAARFRGSCASYISSSWGTANEGSDADRTFTWKDMTFNPDSASVVFERHEWDYDEQFDTVWGTRNYADNQYWEVDGRKTPSTRSPWSYWAAAMGSPIDSVLLNDVQHRNGGITEGIFRDSDSDTLYRDGNNGDLPASWEASYPYNDLNTHISVSKEDVEAAFFDSESYCRMDSSVNSHTAMTYGTSANSDATTPSPLIATYMFGVRSQACMYFNCNDAVVETDSGAVLGISRSVIQSINAWMGHTFGYSAMGTAGTPQFLTAPEYDVTGKIQLASWARNIVNQVVGQNYPGLDLSGLGGFRKVLLAGVRQYDYDRDGTGGSLRYLRGMTYCGFRQGADEDGPFPSQFMGNNQRYTGYGFGSINVTDPNSKFDWGTGQAYWTPNYLTCPHPMSVEQDAVITDDGTVYYRTDCSSSDGSCEKWSSDPSHVKSSTLVLRMAPGDPTLPAYLSPDSWIWYGEYFYLDYYFNPGLVTGNTNVGQDMNTQTPELGRAYGLMSQRGYRNWPGCGSFESKNPYFEDGKEVSDRWSSSELIIPAQVYWPDENGHLCDQEKTFIVDGQSYPRNATHDPVCRAQADGFALTSTTSYLVEHPAYSTLWTSLQQATNTTSGELTGELLATNQHIGAYGSRNLAAGAVFVCEKYLQRQEGYTELYGCDTLFSGPYFPEMSLSLKAARCKCPSLSGFPYLYNDIDRNNYRGHWVGTPDMSYYLRPELFDRVAFTRSIACSACMQEKSIEQKCLEPFTMPLRSGFDPAIRQSDFERDGLWSKVFAGAEDVALCTPFTEQASRHLQRTLPQNVTSAAVGSVAAVSNLTDRFTFSDLGYDESHREHDLFTSDMIKIRGQMVNFPLPVSSDNGDPGLFGFFSQSPDGASKGNLLTETTWLEGGALNLTAVETPEQGEETIVISGDDPRFVVASEQSLTDHMNRLLGFAPGTPEARPVGAYENYDAVLFTTTPNFDDGNDALECNSGDVYFQTGHDLDITSGASGIMARSVADSDHDGLLRKVEKVVEDYANAGCTAMTGESRANVIANKIQVKEGSAFSPAGVKTGHMCVYAVELTHSRPGLCLFDQTGLDFEAGDAVIPGKSVNPATGSVWTFVDLLRFANDAKAEAAAAGAGTTPKRKVLPLDVCDLMTNPPMKLVPENATSAQFRAMEQAGMHTPASLINFYQDTFAWNLKDNNRTGARGYPWVFNNETGAIEFDFHRLALGLSDGTTVGGQLSQWQIENSLSTGLQSINGPLIEQSRIKQDVYFRVCHDRDIGTMRCSGRARVQSEFQCAACASSGAGAGGNDNAADVPDSGFISSVPCAEDGSTGAISMLSENVIQQNTDGSTVESVVGDFSWNMQVMVGVNSDDGSLIAAQDTCALDTDNGVSGCDPGPDEKLLSGTRPIVRVEFPNKIIHGISSPSYGNLLCTHVKGPDRFNLKPVDLGEHRDPDTGLQRSFRVDLPLVNQTYTTDERDVIWAQLAELDVNEVFKGYKIQETRKEIASTRTDWQGNPYNVYNWVLETVDYKMTDQDTIFCRVDLIARFFDSASTAPEAHCPAGQIPDAREHLAQTLSMWPMAVPTFKRSLGDPGSFATVPGWRYLAQMKLLKDTTVPKLINNVAVNLADNDDLLRWLAAADTETLVQETIAALKAAFPGDNAAARAAAADGIAYDDVFLDAFGGNLATMYMTAGVFGIDGVVGVKPYLAENRFAVGLDYFPEDSSLDASELAEIHRQQSRILGSLCQVAGNARANNAGSQFCIRPEAVASLSSSMTNFAVRMFRNIFDISNLSSEDLDIDGLLEKNTCPVDYMGSRIANMSACGTLVSHDVPVIPTEGLIVDLPANTQTDPFGTPDASKTTGPVFFSGMRKSPYGVPKRTQCCKEEHATYSDWTVVNAAEYGSHVPQSGHPAWSNSNGQSLNSDGQSSWQVALAGHLRKSAVVQRVHERVCASCGDDALYDKDGECCPLDRAYLLEDKLRASLIKNDTRHASVPDRTLKERYASSMEIGCMTLCTEDQAKDSAIGGLFGASGDETGGYHIDTAGYTARGDSVADFPGTELTKRSLLVVDPAHPGSTSGAHCGIYITAVKTEQRNVNIAGSWVQRTFTSSVDTRFVSGATLAGGDLPDEFLPKMNTVDIMSRLGFPAGLTWQESSYWNSDWLMVDSSSTNAWPYLSFSVNNEQGAPTALFKKGGDQHYDTAAPVREEVTLVSPETAGPSQIANIKHCQIGGTAEQPSHVYGVQRPGQTACCPLSEFRLHSNTDAGSGGGDSGDGSDPDLVLRCTEPTSHTFCDAKSVYESLPVASQYEFSEVFLDKKRNGHVRVRRPFSLKMDLSLAYIAQPPNAASAGALLETKDYNTDIRNAAMRKAGMSEQVIQATNANPSLLYAFDVAAQAQLVAAGVVFPSSSAPVPGNPGDTSWLTGASTPYLDNGHYGFEVVEIDRSKPDLLPAISYTPETDGTVDRVRYFQGDDDTFNDPTLVAPPRYEWQLNYYGTLQHPNSTTFPTDQSSVRLHTLLNGYVVISPDTGLPLYDTQSLVYPMHANFKFDGDDEARHVAYKLIDGLPGVLEDTLLKSITKKTEDDMAKTVPVADSNVDAACTRAYDYTAGDYAVSCGSVAIVPNPCLNGIEDAEMNTLKRCTLPDTENPLGFYFQDNNGNYSRCCDSGMIGTDGYCLEAATMSEHVLASQGYCTSADIDAVVGGGAPSTWFWGTDTTWYPKLFNFGGAGEFQCSGFWGSSIDLRQAESCDITTTSADGVTTTVGGIHQTGVLSLCCAYDVFFSDDRLFNFFGRGECPIVDEPPPPPPPLAQTADQFCGTGGDFEGMDQSAVNAGSGLLNDINQWYWGVWGPAQSPFEIGDTLGWCAQCLPNKTLEASTIVGSDSQYYNPDLGGLTADFLPLEIQDYMQLWDFNPDPPPLDLQTLFSFALESGGYCSNFDGKCIETVNEMKGYTCDAVPDLSSSRRRLSASPGATPGTKRRAKRRALLQSTTTAATTVPAGSLTASQGGRSVAVFTTFPVAVMGPNGTVITEEAHVAAGAGSGESSLEAQRADSDSGRGRSRRRGHDSDDDEMGLGTWPTVAIVVAVLGLMFLFVGNLGGSSSSPSCQSHSSSIPMHPTTTMAPTTTMGMRSRGYRSLSGNDDW